MMPGHINQFIIDRFLVPQLKHPSGKSTHLYVLIENREANLRIEMSHSSKFGNETNIFMDAKVGGST
jgi:hypothetical protein